MNSVWCLIWRLEIGWRIYETLETRIWLVKESTKVVMKRITFTIGQGFDKDGTAFNAPGLLMAARQRLGTVFNGFTETNAAGGYFSIRHKMVMEPSVQFEVCTNDLGRVREVAAYLRDLFNQECVMLVIQPVDIGWNLFSPLAGLSLGIRLR